MQLRCTLTAWETKYQVRFLSTFGLNSRSDVKYTNINPWFVTGFTDAEGSFMIKLTKRNGKWTVKLDYSIGVHIKDLDLIKSIANFFNVGSVRISGTVCYFTVRGIDDIINIIIPHFDLYTLQSCKRADYLLFRTAAFLLKSKVHFKSPGLQQVINLRASINRGITDILKQEFPLTVPVGRIVFSPDLPLNPFWIAGFTTGDGHFSYFFEKLSNGNEVVRLRFNLTQHIRDEVLIKCLMEQFNCGSYHLNKESYNYNVYGYRDNKAIIAPFFLRYPVLGNKANQFNIWLQALDIMENKLHLTPAGLALLKDLKKHF